MDKETPDATEDSGAIKEDAGELSSLPPEETAPEEVVESLDSPLAEEPVLAEDHSENIHPDSAPLHEGIEEPITSEDPEEEELAQSPMEYADAEPPLTPTSNFIQNDFDTTHLEEAHANISHQVFDLSERVSSFSASNSAIVAELHKVSEETDQLLQWSQQVKITSALSRLFLILSILSLLILIGGMSYLGFLYHKANARLNAVEATLADALKLQQKRLGDYDRHFSELVGKELHGEMESRQKASLQERLNRLRGGNTEQRIYRKNSGDWFVVTGQTESFIADPEVIEVLNHAFVKSGKQLVTRSPMPPHRFMGLLRADARGGTEIVITSEVLP